MGSTNNTTYYACVLLRRKPDNPPIPGLVSHCWVEGTRTTKPYIEAHDSHEAAGTFVDQYREPRYNNSQWEIADARIDTDHDFLQAWAMERWELLNALES